MRLLDRYLLRELLVPLGYCLGGFMIFWISFDLFSNLGRLQEGHLSASEIVQYYTLRLPDLLVLVLPIALLLGLLYAVNNHARHQELTAIRAAGISLWRLSAPYFMVGLLFAGGLFYLNETYVPGATEATEELLNKHSPSNTNTMAYPWRPSVNFRNAAADRFWTIAAFNVETGEMRKPQVEWIDGQGVRQHLFAQRAIRTNEGWRFEDVDLFSYPKGERFEPGQLRTNEMRMPQFDETPEEIKVTVKFSKLSTIDATKKPQLALSEIRYLRRHLQLNQRDKWLLDTQYQARLALPWTCLVVVVIALPFGAASGRRNAFVGVASSILICFAFFILSRFGLALGTGGYIPAWVAAWTPNVLFGVGGAFLTSQAR